MKAAFTTDGNTTTQRALLSRSCGILSGTFRISSITVPAFSRRFSSLSLSLDGPAKVAGAINSSAAARYVKTFISHSSRLYSVFIWSLSIKTCSAFTYDLERSGQFLRPTQSRPESVAAEWFYAHRRWRESDRCPPRLCAWGNRYPGRRGPGSRALPAPLQSGVRFAFWGPQIFTKTRLKFAPRPPRRLAPKR